MYGHCTWNPAPMNGRPYTWQGFDGFNEFEGYDWNTPRAGWTGTPPWWAMGQWNFMNQWSPMNQWRNMGPFNWTGTAPWADSDWNRSSWAPSSGFNPSGANVNFGFGDGTASAEAA